MFIYISTPSIYFKYKDQFNINEESPISGKFVNAYAATKYLAEQEILNYSEENIIKVVLRPRALIGAGDTVIVPRIIRAFEAGKLRIIGNGNNFCDFTSVKNMAHAICLAIEAGNDIDGKIFNITDDDHKHLWYVLKYALGKLGYNPNLKKINFRLVFAIASIIETIHKIFNLGEPVLTRYGIGLLNYSQTFDILKAKKILKYKPVITTEESINEYVISIQNDNK